MTLIDGSIGFLPRFMWCGRADIPGMPSPRAQDYWGAVTFFARVIEGRTAYAGRSDLSPSSTLTGQRSNRMAPYGAHRGREADKDYGPAAGRRNCCPTVRRNLGNPCAEKVLQDRSRQNNRCAHRSVRHHERPLPWKASRLRDSSAGFCLAETMGLRSGGSGMGGASAMAHRHIFQ